MPIELAGIHLERIHEITTLEQAAFVSHRVPGLEGNIVQNMGRNSVRLQIKGIFYGTTANDDVESLREIYKAKEAVDFLAEIVGQAYFGQVILERFEVVQRAQEPDQFSYVLTVAEYVEPPEPEQQALSDVDSALLEEAQNFMEIAGLPDMLSVPNFGDPTIPLNSILDGIESTLGSLTDSAQILRDLFGEA